MRYKRRYNQRRKQRRNRRYNRQSNNYNFSEPRDASWFDMPYNPQEFSSQEEAYDATIGAMLRHPPDYLQADAVVEVPTIIGAVLSPLPPSSVTILTDDASYEQHFRGGSSNVINHQMVLRDWNGFNRLTVVGTWASHGGGYGVNYFACAIGILLEHQITLRLSNISRQLYDRIENREITHSQLESLLDDDRSVRTIWESGNGLEEDTLKIRSSDVYEWVAGRQSDILELARLGKLTELLHGRAVVQWGTLDPELAQLKSYVKGSSPEDDGTVIAKFSEGDIDVVINKATRIFEDRVRTHLNLSETDTNMTRITQRHYRKEVHDLFEGFRRLIRNPGAHSVQRSSYSHMRRVLQMTDFLLELVDDPSSKKG